MAKASPLQSNFNGGEFSPYLYGRVDADRYKTGLATCKNYIPTVQGGLIRRPGNAWVSEARYSNKAARLQRFEFSTTQAYQLEFGDSYVRFYRNDGQVLEFPKNFTGATQANPCQITAAAHGFSDGDEVYISGANGMTQINARNFIVTNITANTFTLKYLDGSAVDSTLFSVLTSGGTVARVYTLTTGYAEADLFELSFVQSADTLYITHPNYFPRQMARLDHASWTIANCAFLDGPYIPENKTTTTLTFSGATGSITVTASSIVGINSDTGFQTTDIGRLIRSKQAGACSWLRITARTSTTIVTAAVVGPAVVSGSAHTTWRLGAWSDTTLYPAVAVFHEDRLCFAGCPSFPQRVDMSNTGDYVNFAPSGTDLVIIDSNALSFNLNSNDVNSIRWMVSQARGLLAGSVGGEWLITPSVNVEAITPTNISAKQVTYYGSAAVQPVLLAKSVLFLTRSSRKLREMSYYFESDGFESPDRSVLSEHITGATGIKQMAYQKDPQSIVWCVRNDGVLVGMTYEHYEETLIIGWHRHILGGYSDAAQSPAIVESVSTIPSSDGTRDELWMVVRRRINGQTKRYIEYSTKFFEDSDEQKDAFFLDAALKYDSPLTISNIVTGINTFMTITAHGLNTGDDILVSDVLGMSEINGVTLRVTVIDANTVSLSLNGAALNSVGFSEYVSGGEARRYIKVVSGLWHLEGESVDILADGAVQAPKTVLNGSITLDSKATTIAIGLGYQSDGQMLRLEAGATDGTALCKTRRTTRVGILFHRSLGLKIGTDFENMTTLTFRKTSDPASRATALFSGVRSEVLEADYDYDNMIAWRQDQPLPSTILAVAPQVVLQDAQ